MTLQIRLHKETRQQGFGIYFPVSSIRDFHLLALITRNVGGVISSLLIFTSLLRTKKSYQCAAPTYVLPSMSHLANQSTIATGDEHYFLTKQCSPTVADEDYSVRLRLEKNANERWARTTTASRHFRGGMAAWEDGRRAGKTGGQGRYRRGYLLIVKTLLFGHHVPSHTGVRRSVCARYVILQRYVFARIVHVDCNG